MMNSKYIPLAPLCLALAWGGLTQVLKAQEVKPVQEEVIELSPFVVESNSEEGYVATQSLAGTRARAELRDIASSISVMTPELLEDIGATDMQDALKYSLNTESEFEFAPNDGEGDSTSTLIQTRTRGIVSSTTSRNFFNSRLRVDGYNTERLTMAQGPNSILFGLGSPAGFIDGTLTRARDSKKPFGSVSVQYDSYNGRRATFDLNVPLIKKYLSVRYALLDQEKKYFTSPDNDDEKRKYITFTSQPWKGATIRGYYEGAKIKRVLGRQQLPYDYISDWIAEGRPLYDYTRAASPARWTYDNGATWEAWRGVNGYPEPGLSGNDNPVYVVEGGVPIPTSAWDTFTLPATRETWRAAWKQQAGQALNYARTPESWNSNQPEKTFSDGSIIPLNINLNGANSSTDFDVRAYTATFEQKITKDFFIELAYNHEIYKNVFFDSFRGSNIYADVNYYVPITQPLGTGVLGTGPRPFITDNSTPSQPIRVLNPNRGQFYNESSTIGRDENVETETRRATASYELDLTKKNRWLGRYNLAAMLQQDRYDTFRVKTRLFSTGSYRNFTTAQAGQNTILNRAYINLPGVSPETTAPEYPGPYLSPAENGLDWWTTYLGAIHDDGRPEMSARDVFTRMMVAQGYWKGPFNDSLVGTFGYREDKVDIYDSVGEFRNSAGVWQTANMRLLTTPDKLNGLTRTIGLVYHTPAKWLSVFYNKSNNFSPFTDKKDVFGHLLKFQKGQGEEYGFLIEAFNRKLSLRVNAYRNSAQGALENNFYFNGMKDNVLNYVEAKIRTIIGNDPNHPDYFADFTSFDNQVTLTRDYVAKGYEAEMFVRPMKGLDIRLTVSKSESTNVRAFPIMQEFVALRMPVWEKYYDRSATTPFAVVPGNWQNNPTTIGYHLFNDAQRYPRYYEGISGEGLPSQLNRKWRANLIVNYAFQGKPLKGWSTGFGTRWREKAAIGYMPIASTYLPGATMPDLNNPVYGEDQLFFDVWLKYNRKFRYFTWTLYGKIDNPFVNSPKIAPYEASYQLNGAITKWQVEADRKFTISSKFAF